jgi:hypothetical protein
VAVFPSTRSRSGQSSTNISPPNRRLPKPNQGWTVVDDGINAEQDDAILHNIEVHMGGVGLHVKHVIKNLERHGHRIVIEKDVGLLHAVAE